MKHEDFLKLSKEVMPVLDKMTETLGRYRTEDKLASITLCADGYISFTVFDSGMSLNRVKKEDEPEVVVRSRLHEETDGREN